MASSRQPGSSGIALAVENNEAAISESVDSPAAHTDGTDGIAAGQTDTFETLANAMRQANQQFAASVVIPTYAEFNSQTQQLAEAGAAFATAPSPETLQTLEQAWLGSAAAWAKSRAFAFGPVHSLGHGAALESPLDEAGVAVLLSESADLSPEDWSQVALQPSVKGFEAIAFVLNGLAGDRPYSDFSSTERLYLQRLTASAHEASTALLAVWQTGYDNAPAYETVLATAGGPGNGAYLSVEAGTEEIVRGLINALDEMTAEELPGLREEANEVAAETDQTALRLLGSALAGMEAAYLGTTEAATKLEPNLESVAGISQWVALAQAETDLQIQQGLQTAITDLNQAIAQPNADHIAVRLESAQTALSTVQTLLTEDVLLMTQTR